MVPGPRTTPVSVVRFFFQGTAAAPPAPARARGGSDGWRSAQRAIRGRPDRTGGRRRRRLRDPAVALQPGQLLLGPPWLGPAGDHPPPQDQRERRRAERRAGLTRLGGVGADGAAGADAAALTPCRRPGCAAAACPRSAARARPSPPPAGTP